MAEYGLIPSSDHSASPVYRSAGRQPQADISSMDTVANQWNFYEYSKERMSLRTFYAPLEEDWKTSSRSSYTMDGDYVQVPYFTSDNGTENLIGRMDQGPDHNSVFDHRAWIKKEAFSEDPTSVYTPESSVSQYGDNTDEDILDFLKSLIGNVGGNSTTASQMAQSYPYERKEDKAKVKADKPSRSYIDLIATAILSSVDKKVLLKDIYKFFIKAAEKTAPSWKNSVRYSLSINECFVKVGKSSAPNSAKYNYWSIHPTCMEAFSRGDFKHARSHVTHHKRLKNVSKCSQETSVALKSGSFEDSVPATAPLQQYIPMTLST